MPPSDLAPLIASINTGFASVVTAIGAHQPVDLAPLTDQVGRVANAAIESNAQIASVIKADTSGDNRVMIDPNAP